MTFILLFAFSCEQQDESADVNAEQANTEVRARQMQVKAREIVNSEEYQNFVDQNRLFLSKIHSEDFLTKEFIDEENATYNYDLIRERLSMTSFKSVEEFVQEYENAFYNTQKLLKKYPKLTNPSPELKEKVTKEYLKKVQNKRDKKLRFGNPCGFDCSNDKWYCKNDAENDGNWKLWVVCGSSAVIATIASGGCNIIAGGAVLCTCVIGVYSDYIRSLDHCDDKYFRCLNNCMW